MKTKVAVFGGVMGAAMALTGCMGATGSATSELGWVPLDANGRTDLFLVGDRLVTANEIGDASDAIQVEIAVQDWTLTATRFDTNEVVGTWQALDEVPASDIPTATPIDGELNPGGEPIVVPGGTFPNFPGGHETIPNGAFDEYRPGLVIDWTERTGGIPNSTDVEEWQNLENAHPGCA